METTMAVPPWLEPLFKADFFTVCRSHRGATKSECNMYCLDCNVDSFCLHCRSSKHKDHRVIQIRRSSYHDVVRVSEIEMVLDISGIQTYVINSARVLFLNERPQPKAGKSVSHICEICTRSLLDTSRFCSLACKLEGIKRNGDASFVLEGKNIDAEVDRRRRGGEGMPRMTISSSRENEEGLQQAIYPPTTLSSSRRRKGIPHRAPFGS
ncbi:protein RGF1 INDUCIBLE TRANSCRIPTION FACTOR 1-like [Impatiens glandulifera]|uniref:protein RGF1 INDUCIBLE TRANSCRIPTION FACTOR 1-like n=1 Tax=Impatiens glandulifera TaxID=253017 RepID=UPI001FB14D8C|nr:protein RGF1 INDUCIBLE TRANSCRIPTION FACTOR 1-like [Impatiens glandulifera]